MDHSLKSPALVDCSIHCPWTFSHLSFDCVVQLIVIMVTMHLVYPYSYSHHVRLQPSISVNHYFTIFQLLSLAFVMVHFGAFNFLSGMADKGIDLNVQSGMAEHAKDIILLTTAVQILSLASGYFVALWLLVRFLLQCILILFVKCEEKTFSTTP